jgi:hypothetical protein
MSALGSILRDLKRQSNSTLSELTVLSAVNDPFRIDTPTFHEAGAWLRDQMQASRLLGRVNPIHNRGIHYALVSRDNISRPDGASYINDADSWEWLQNVASKAARWLGYVPFDAISDARNEAPIIGERSRPEPSARVRFDAEIYLPDHSDLEPEVVVSGFESRQAFHLVFYGEKTSLAEVLDPLAQRFLADLYLPAGEISDTLLHRMARNGAEDGRPMVVFIFADCDPAGYQMAVSIGHKLRALRESFYPSLEFQVFAPALTVEQVRELGLPSTPLKETEKGAAGWRDRYGIEQTEIDALATLTPDVLRGIAEAAVHPFWDRTLESRVRDARHDWLHAAQEALDEQLSPDRLAHLNAGAEAEIERARERLQEISAAIDEADIDLPSFDIPEPIIGDDLPAALVSSDMPLAEAIRKLRDRKRYGDGP